jgi:hypothetical protein
VRVYFDTGIFIDYLSIRGSANSLLRSSERRGRSPADVAADAERLFGAVSRSHIGATSCFMRQAQLHSMPTFWGNSVTVNETPKLRAASHRIAVKDAFDACRDACA